MPCYHPIEAWDLSPDQFDLLSKRVISFQPPPVASRQRLIDAGRRLLLPCRHCVGCRLAKSRDWANRVVLEQLYHDESWFLTLTYDDEHLPPAYPTDPATGEILSVHASLVKHDLQCFFKRLRKYSGQFVRYFASGEYGSSTYRPHYHAIIFGLHLDDYEVVSHGFDGTPYYTSDFVAKCWPYGNHILGKVTWQSAAYVARYTVKKATHGFDLRYYAAAGIEPEFQVSSRRPGLGRRYYDDHPELFDYSNFSVRTPYGGRKMYPPEYYRRLYAASNPVDSYVRSFQSNVEADNLIHLKLLLTDADYLDILKIAEERELSRITSLIRNTV